MKSVLFTALLCLLCACSLTAQTCASRPGRADGNEKKYAKTRLAGDQAFREGKYEKALAEYRQSLISSDDNDFNDAYFKLGETYAMLGNFDKAYACLIESGPGKPPKNRIIATGIDDQKARESAQILLDTIQVNTPRYPYATFPEYLALAAILRHVGLEQEAQSAEEEGRINLDAANAWNAALDKDHATLAEADQAAIKVYEQSNRPEPAEILRAQSASEPPLPRRKRSWWYQALTLNY